MQIGGRTIDRDAPPFIIAEIGVNHDGSRARALELVDAAHRTGADAVKFQVFDAHLLLSRAARLAAYQQRSGESDPADMLTRLSLSLDDLAPAVDRAHAHGMAALATVFSTELVPAAGQLPWDAWKIASPDIINRPLINALCTDGRPLLLSTGAATLDEVQQAVQWVQPHPHILMQCVSAYPVPDELASLAGRRALESISSFALGYSDHTTSTLTGAIAVASGARVLEKHFTHDQQASGPDHAASLDAPAFQTYVELSHRAFAMLGPAVKSVLDIERDVRRLSRQSVVARQPLAEGHTLQRDDLTIKRPGTGLPPELIDELIGRTVLRAIERDMPVMPDAVQ